jgi:CBS domain-containing protein
VTVKSILNTKGSAVVGIGPDATAQEAAELMEECRIGALVVTSSDFVAGLLTQRDLTKGLARLGGKLATTPVKELMQYSFVSVSPEESTIAVMALMTRRRATHLPVMDRGRLLGIVSIGDVVKDRLHDLEIVASARRRAHVMMH